MKEASQNVTYQVPTEHTRVGYLLDGIESDSPALHAAIATVRNDKDSSRKSFDLAVAILVPSDPFTRNESLKASKNISFNISGADGSATSQISKNGRGAKTNVDLRWHTATEFAALSRDKKTELSGWQRTDDGKKATSDARNQHFNAKKHKKFNAGKKDEKKLKARVAALEKDKAKVEKEAEDKARVS